MLRFAELDALNNAASSVMETFAGVVRICGGSGDSDRTAEAANPMSIRDVRNIIGFHAPTLQKAGGIRL